LLRRLSLVQLHLLERQLLLLIPDLLSVLSDLNAAENVTDVLTTARGELCH
jgi:hypothetical protein